MDVILECVCYVLVFALSFGDVVFFFKQKTAYEMRISDWSSDVCSSDLAFLVAEAGVLDPAEGRHLDAVARNLPDVDRPDAQLGHETGDMLEVVGADAGGQAVGRRVGDPDRVVDIREADHRRDGAESLLAHQLASVGVSEEHTSELQTPMRNSYA